MTVHKTDNEQALANVLKTIRTAVRLKHTLAADEELNTVLPEAELRFNAALQRGKQLTPIEVKRAVGL